MLSQLAQLAKLATKLDSVGLRKEADVLDAFIKRAAKKNQTDGEWVVIPEHWHDKRTKYSDRTPYRYHPGSGDEADFDKWINDNIDRSDGIMSSVKRQSDNGPMPDFDYDRSDFADDGNEWTDGEEEDESERFTGWMAGNDKDSLRNVLAILGSDTDVEDMTDDEISSMLSNVRNMLRQ